MVRQDFWHVYVSNLYVSNLYVSNLYVSNFQTEENFDKGNDVDAQNYNDRNYD